MAENKFYQPLEGPAKALDDSLADGRIAVTEAAGVLMALGIAGYSVVVAEGGSFDANDQALMTDAIRQHYNEKFTKYDLPGSDVIWDYIITTVIAPGISAGVGYAVNHLPKVA